MDKVTLIHFRPMEFPIEFDTVKSGIEVINIFYAQLNSALKFIMLINVKIPIFFYHAHKC